MHGPDPIFADPRLAGIYDVLDGERDDLDLYVRFIESIAARTVLDIGCGTGTLACRLALAGYDVIGVDPAAASLAVARTKVGADRVTWRTGRVESLDSANVEVATMTANVAQVFLDDADWTATLAEIRRHLVPGGRLIFETRDPAAGAWERWNRTESFNRADVPGAGFVQSWVELIDVDLPFVSFRWSYRFEADDVVITSDSTLRFRSQDEISESLGVAGFEILEVLDAPDRPGQEFVFVAAAR